ncbi:hypothetical protein [Lacipirellula parvula]|uniref:Uncharacterized protein n=1 Tax=Lacipirellula parvula TaxID=2650471 RepID=A0A5K7XDG3_9BACT|nr:hypothetical protein [Lacipirellula parvula]BBO32446.1 hypothetical protein PLANPX_2058 [Lacipirellula parvula]
MSTAAAEETRVPVKFAGGHDISKKDFGRPIPLIAAALGVKPEVFRKAFSGVTPARGRGPSGAEARKNKEALLSVLGPHGVTNERLDEVSDYYRFRPQEDELWPVKAAKAEAIVEDGQIKRIVVTEPGHGYSTPPRASVKGFSDAKLHVELAFSKTLKKNGAVKAIEIDSK